MLLILPFDIARFLKAITVFAMSLLLSACAAALLMPGAGNLLAGAATSMADSMTNSNSEIKVDPDDPCGPQRIALGASRNYFLKSIISGAMTGALVGVGIAVLTGGGGRAIGQAALGGALAGGVTGAVQANQQEAAGAQALQNSFGTEVINEYKELDKATQSFITLRDCRFTAARAVKSGYKSKRITREVSLQRLDRLKTMFDDDIVIAEEIGVKMSERAKTYTEKSEEVLRNNPVASADYNQWVAQQEQEKLAPKTVISKSKSKSKLKSKSSSAKTKVDEQKIASGDALSVAQRTHGNLLQQVNFTNQVVQSKQMASKEFSLEGKISMDFPIPRNFNLNTCLA